MIYLLIATYLFLLMAIYDWRNAHQGKQFHYYFSLVILILLMGLRYRVGGDTLNYIYTFENATSTLENLTLFENLRRQPIPAFIFSFVKTCFDDFTIVQLIFAIFVNSVVFWFIKRYTKYIFTAVFLYALCFYMRFNCEIMRESLAVSFFLLGYPALVDKRFAKFYLYATLSFLSHASASFIFVLPILLYSGKLWLKIVCVVILIAVALYFNEFLSKLFTSYINDYNDYNSTLYGKLSIIIFQVLLPLFFLEKTKTKIGMAVRKGVLIYVWCGVASLFFYILYRCNNYTVLFYIILAADAICQNIHNPRLQGKIKQAPVYMFVFCISFMLPYFSDVSNITGRPIRWYVCWYPYYSVFDPQVSSDRELFINRQFGY